MATVKVQNLLQHMQAEREKFRARGNHATRIFSIQIPECSHLYSVEGHGHSMPWREIYGEDGDGFGQPGRWFRTSNPCLTEGGFKLPVRLKSRWSGMYYLTVCVPPDTEVRVRSVAW